jgi:hypothetical protein
VTGPATVLLGVRHHGPGSARAVWRALSAYRPDVVLVEGPPEAEAVVSLAADPDMSPPVALLAYPLDDKAVAAATSRAAFWPLAEFSPEWQAIRWALRNGVPVRFCDLPAAARFGREPRTPEVPAEPAAVAEPGAVAEPAAVAERVGPAAAEVPGGARPDEDVRADPIGALAAAAGYDDPERWWEDVVEHRLDHGVGTGHGDDRGGAGGTDARADEAAALAPFTAIAEAMAEVRAGAAAPAGPEQVAEERREAHMRTVLRAAQRRFARIAVVCGAWHVPALTPPLPTATADARTLRGMGRTKIAMTWVPWTHGRLAAWQGYGAGVSSPGWYHHLFTAPDQAITRWFVQVAAVLRAEGLPVSSAHVIEAVRLAEALATLRARPLAGLAEVTDATRAVLCDGDALRLALVNRKLVVGERLGAVPAHTPSVPLVRDLAAAQRRLRLPAEALTRDLDLDLRREIDLNRSRLLHRLRLLDIGWGEPAETARRGKGTFWESWRLQWQPEFAVDLIAASGYGTTVLAAATARAVERAAAAPTLAAVTELVERCLLADVPAAMGAVLRALDERVALDQDVGHMMTALPALARTLRYGDVRGTDTAALRAVTSGLVVRVCVGLPAAVGSLDDSAATAVRDQIDAVHPAIALLDDGADATGLSARWLDVLARLVERDDLHGLLAGRLTRLLLDTGRLGTADVGRRMALVLTAGVPVGRAASWVEGFLAMSGWSGGGGLLLVHDERLLRLVDTWLAGIAADTFVEVLPLLRRTFSTFTGPERRSVGERVRRLAGGTASGRRAARPPGADGDVLAGDGFDEAAIDAERAALVLPTVSLLLGWQDLEAVP